MKHVIIFSATGTRESAESIAARLIELHYAACVQILPMESFYRWDGKVQHEPEFLLNIKTTTVRAADVEMCIKEMHTYDLPEISMVDMIGGSKEYLSWIVDSVKP